MEYLQRHISSTTQLVFFWNRPLIDRWSSVLAAEIPCPLYYTRTSSWTKIKWNKNLNQNKICYRMHAQYTSFFCFLIICLSPIWKFLFLWNRSYLRNFWYIEGSSLNVFHASADTICYVPTILLSISWKYKYWCLQKGLCDILKPLYI